MEADLPVRGLVFSPSSPEIYLAGQTVQPKITIFASIPKVKDLTYFLRS